MDLPSPSPLEIPAIHYPSAQGQELSFRMGTHERPTLLGITGDHKLGQMQDHDHHEVGQRSLNRRQESRPQPPRLLWRPRLLLYRHALLPQDQQAQASTRIGLRSSQTPSCP